MSGASRIERAEKLSRKIGALSTEIADDVIFPGPTRDQDIAEMEAAFHVVQGMLARHVLALQDPKKYRPLGGVVVS